MDEENKNQKQNNSVSAEVKHAEAIEPKYYNLTSFYYFNKYYKPQHPKAKFGHLNTTQKKQFNDGFNKHIAKADKIFKLASKDPKNKGPKHVPGSGYFHEKGDKGSNKVKVDTKPLTGHEYDDYIKASNQKSDDPKVAHLLQLIQEYDKCKDPREANNIYAKRIDAYAAQSNDPKVKKVHDKMAGMAARAACTNTKWGKQHIGVAMANMSLVTGPLKKVITKMNFKPKAKQNEHSQPTKSSNNKSKAAKSNSKNEDYVNKATMNPFWTKKLHKPIVNLDTKHRADVDPASPYAGKHIMTYVSKDGQMIHTQVISGDDFNRIRKANHKKPFSFKDFMNHMKHHIPLATAASNLAFRAKTFIHNRLSRVRDRAAHFIDTVSITASRFKFSFKREIQAEHQAHQFRNRKLKIRLATSDHKHPYDAFNYVSPKEMNHLLGNNPKDYVYAQDYVQAHDPHSPFNTKTPLDMNMSGNHPDWRQQLSSKDMSRYREMNQPQQFTSFNPTRQCQDDGPDL